MGAATAALKEVGYATSQSDTNPERDVEWFQFLLRDTGAWCLLAGVHVCRSVGLMF
jgi:hypothetical protein